MAVTICKYSSSTDQITGFLSRVDLYADYPAELSHLISFIFNVRFIVRFLLESGCDEENKLPLLKALTTLLAQSNELIIATAEQLHLQSFWLLFLLFNLDDLFVL
ncbi:hypothetical protein VPH35_003410 [Triticum aestivum]